MIHLCLVECTGYCLPFVGDLQEGTASRIGQCMNSVAFKNKTKDCHVEAKKPETEFSITSNKQSSTAGSVCGPSSSRHKPRGSLFLCWGEWVERGVVATYRWVHHHKRGRRGSVLLITCHAETDNVKGSTTDESWGWEGTHSKQ